MNALAIIQIVVALLTGVATAAKAGGLTIIAEAVGAALVELQKVHGTDVTKGQLDSLSVTPQW
jgi:hypothetical protein